uniref:Uncharacterized protein n=1 Tax=Anguilla anguilla TaxID=7936 RepID=A0A0E9W7Y4_ANGAN
MRKNVSGSARCNEIKVLFDLVLSIFMRVI